MKAYDFYQEWQKLSESQRDYAIGFMTGGFDCVATGFTTPHKDSGKANWAIKTFGEAVTAAAKQPAKAQAFRAPVRTWPYGAEMRVVVQRATEREIIVISDGGEGFILFRHGVKPLPSANSSGVIVFAQGGPTGGYWKWKKSGDGG